MINKIYYGEYSLKHWINLMLEGDIVLPEYQRHFVWSERDVKRLIQSLREGQFVQPVTIALFNDGTKKTNLILDGQQRLTSILLAYLGYFPDKNKFESAMPEKIANEDDSAIDDEELSNCGFLWRYSKLLEYGNTRPSIIDGILNDGRYIKFVDSLLLFPNDDFFNNAFLGFSYVVPDSTNPVDVQLNFSKLFRNINYFGKQLSPVDSRKSLYYQNPSLTHYFDGQCRDDSNVLDDLMIVENFQPSKIDFVRYLSILSQYVNSDRTDGKDVMVGYSAYSSRESFYADYVSYVLGIEQEDRINKFDSFIFKEIFPDNCWQERFIVLQKVIRIVKKEMNLKNHAFSAWYEADYWLFGLLYHVLFKGKNIIDSFSRMDKSGDVFYLKNEIEQKIMEDKSNPLFDKNANRLGYLRERLVSSCRIWADYVQ